MKKVERWKTEMPTEQEMLPKDKYTVFDRKVKRYRKGIHSKWHTIWNHIAGAFGGKTENLVIRNECILTIHRGTEVDEGQSATQPPWFLDGPHHEGRVHACILFVIIPAAAYTASCEHAADTSKLHHQVNFAMLYACVTILLVQCTYWSNAAPQKNLQYAVICTGTACSTTGV